MKKGMRMDKGASVRLEEEVLTRWQVWRSRRYTHEYEASFSDFYLQETWGGCQVGEWRMAASRRGLANC